MKNRRRLHYTHEHTLMNWTIVTEVPIKDVECKFRTGRTDPQATLSTLVIIEGARNLSTRDINIHACIPIIKDLFPPLNQTTYSLSIHQMHEFACILGT